MLPFQREVKGEEEERDNLHSLAFHCAKKETTLAKDKEKRDVEKHLAALAFKSFWVTQMWLLENHLPFFWLSTVHFYL